MATATAAATTSRGNLIDSLMVQLESEWRKAGADIIEAKRQDLSIPVGPGSPPIRSVPPEAPRRETGNLQGSLEFRVERGADSVRLIFDTPVEYADWLVASGRTIFQDVPERFGDLVIDAAIAAME